MERLPSDQEKISSIAITVEFFGGLDILFSKQKKHEISIPAQDDLGSPINVAFLIKYLCDNLMRDRRKELFVQDETIRPGILVVINDADWELEGEEKYEIQPGDNILFMSTLHGG